MDEVGETVVTGPAPPREENGIWFADERGIERRLRVSWHGERRLFVLSVWQKDTCTATFRLPVGEVPRLVRALVVALGSALSESAGGGRDAPPPPPPGLRAEGFAGEGRPGARQEAVPRFEPFAGVRYDPERVEPADVLAPPYDIIGPDDLARLEARSPYNVVHVDLSRDDGALSRYDAARCRFDEWFAARVLIADPEPAFYLYRMGWRDEDGQPRQTSGVLGAMDLDPDRSGSVLPHERTMAKPLDDRLRLMRACRANVSPIWALSLADGLGALAQPTDPPVLRCTDDDGVHHRLWRITAPAALDAIGATVASAPVVIADGHHRYETALAYRAERRAVLGDAPGPHDLVLAYVTELADMERSVRPIHRLLSEVPETFPIAEALGASFTLEAAGPPAEDLADRMAAAGALGLVMPGEAFLLRPGGIAASAPLTDSERVEAALGTFPPHAVAYHHDIAQVLALVDKGEAQAGLLLRPTAVDQIAAAAREGRRLPQKTTFFHPKPRTGVVFRLLDERA
ncbi:MAG: DUF1015 family protein [Acidimicrobiales bacterium]